MTGQPTETTRLPKAPTDVVWEGLAEALEPLAKAGQLGSIAKLLEDLGTVG